MAEIKIIELEKSKTSIAKTIDEGAIDLVFDVLQGDIYAFPISSFIRETITNGLDAIIERDIAKKIIQGEDQSNYYLQRTDDKLLKDSSFNRDYYNTDYLSTDSKVYVKYVDEYPRDKIIISDNGVGLGDSRLKGFFTLGWSSKRNMKDVTGKYGSGSKSALATGSDYFIMRTRYNGFETSFMIFKHDYEAITVQHPEGRSEIWNVKMTDETVYSKTIYWKPTDKLNGVELELEVKKHNKHNFINAVRNQFQYFNGRVRVEYEEYDEVQIDLLNEKPLYESDHILIPQYSTYSVPHILVDGISYGIINYPELELESMRGKIALKVKATDIDITQSRETLKYTEKTKKAIVNLIDIAKEEATDYVTSLLDVDDTDNLFLLNDIYGKISKDSSTAVASVFSKFLSMHNIKPKFEFLLGTDSTEISLIKSRIDSELFEFIFYNFRVRELSIKTDSTGMRIDSNRVTDFESIRNKNIVFASEISLGPKLANHLLGKYSVDSIIYIRARTDREKTSIVAPNLKEYDVSSINDYTLSLLESYADLNLDTYDVTYDESVDIDNLSGSIVTNFVTPAQQRRLNKEVLYTRYTLDKSNYYNTISRVRDKYTVKVSNLSNEFPSTVIIVTGKYHALGKFLELGRHINPSITGNEDIIYIAEANIKYFLPYGILVADYIRTVNTNTGELMVGEYIRTLNTARQLQELTNKYSSFSVKYNVLKTLTSVDYGKIEHFTNKIDNRSLETIFKKDLNIDSNITDEIFKYLDTLTEFQNIVKTGNKDLISTKALELFNSDDIYAIDSYDQEFIDSITEQFEHLNVIAPILEEFSKYSDMTKEKVELLQLLINTKHKENGKS